MKEHENNDSKPETPSSKASWKHALGDTLGVGLTEVLFLLGGGAVGLILMTFGLIGLIAPFVVLAFLGVRYLARAHSKK